MFSVTKLHNDENIAKHLFSKFCLDSRNYFPNQSFSHFLLKMPLLHWDILRVCVCLNTAKQAFLIIEKLRNLEQLFFSKRKTCNSSSNSPTFLRTFLWESQSLFMVLRIFMSTPHLSTNYYKCFSTQCNAILRFTIL